MKIECIMEGNRLGWTATPIGFRDLFDFHETMEDWPEDHEGKFTLSRSTLVVNKHVVHSRSIEAPLTNESAFNGVWAVRDASGQWIGYWRDKIKGKLVHTGQTAIHPDQRGKGYFRTFMHMQAYLAFYVYNCDNWSFEVMDEQPALMTKIDRHWDGGADQKGAERQGSTGANVVKFSQSREDQLKRFGTARHAQDIADGLVMTPENAGYSNVFQFTE